MGNSKSRGSQNVIQTDLEQLKTYEILLRMGYDDQLAFDASKKYPKNVMAATDYIAKQQKKISKNDFEEKKQHIHKQPMEEKNTYDEKQKIKILELKQADDSMRECSQHFAKWFNFLEPDLVRFSNRKPYSVKIVYPKTEMKDQESDDQHEHSENGSQLVELVLDILGTDHLSSDTKINENYLANFGDINNMHPEKINDIVQTMSDAIPSTELNELFEDDDTFASIPINLIEQIPKGYLLNKEYMRVLVDSIKCRITLEPFVKGFDLGSDEDMHITVSDLIACLLEICEGNTHKKLLIP
eukprot:268427_1